MDGLTVPGKPSIGAPGLVVPGVAAIGQGGLSTPAAPDAVTYQGAPVLYQAFALTYA